MNGIVTVVSGIGGVVTLPLVMTIIVDAYPRQPESAIVPAVLGGLRSRAEDDDEEAEAAAYRA